MGKITRRLMLGTAGAAVLGGVAYGAVATGAGAGMLWLAWRVYRDRTGAAAVGRDWRNGGFVPVLFSSFPMGRPST